MPSDVSQKDAAPLLHTDPLLNAARESAVIAVHRMRHWADRLGGGAVDSKDGRNNLVTAADAEIEALVRGHLNWVRPGDSVVGEENSAAVSPAEHPAAAELMPLLGRAVASAEVSEAEVSEAETAGGGARCEWHVDPIDGTVNFVRGIEHFCFSAGVRLQDAGANADAGWLAGLVAAPLLDRVWFARDGRAWAAPLAVLSDPQIGAAALTGESAPTRGRVVATGFGYSAERRAQQLSSLGEVMTEFDDLRRCGSAALDLCMAAEGRVNGYYERGLGVYDFAGGAYVAQSAGRFVHRRSDAFGAESEAGGPAPELTAVADTKERLEFLLMHG